MAATLDPKTSYGDTTLRIASVSDEIILTDPMATPTLKYLSPNMDNLSVDAISDPYYWVEDSLMPMATTLASVKLTTGETATFEVAAGYGEYLRKGTVVRIDDELILVGTTTDASKGTDDVGKIATSGRGFGGSTAALHATTATVYFVGQATLETESAWDSFYVTPTMPYNQFQVFSVPVELTRVAQATQQYGISNPQSYHEDKALTDLMKLVNRSIFNGWRRSATSSYPGAFGAFPDTTAAYIHSTHRSAQSSVALAESTIEGGMQTCFEDVGSDNMPKVLVCNAWAKRKISSWWENRARIERGETSIGLVVDRIETDFGPLDVLLDYLCPPNALYLLNPANIGIGPLKGNGQNLAFSWYDIPYSSIGNLRVLWGAYTMEMRAPKTHYAITGFSTTT